VILVGFQAEQTRGRQLAEGARQIKLLGRYVPVRADVVDLPSFSVHADRNELLEWLATASTPPQATYVVHGEPDSSAALQVSITEQLDWNAVVPHYRERVRLD
jgi:metallo-beta-lactamase family protein